MQNPDHLRVSRSAEDLADLIYEFTAGFPPGERFGLTAQMRRSAVSIGSNIFEGCGRQGNRALLPFLYHSHGSASELLFQLRFAMRRSFGDPQLASKLSAALESMQRMLARLIRRIERET